MSRVEGPDLAAQIAQAGARMDPGLSDRDVERLVAGALRRRRQRSGRRRLALTFAVAGVAIASGFALWLRPHGPELASVPPVEPAAREPAADETLTLADGSRVMPLAPLTAFEVLADDALRTEVMLSRGSARFDVRPQGPRSFVVRAADVTITVLGTVFSVERAGERVGVSVERGTVRVSWNGGVSLVEEGERGWYPPPAPAPSAAKLVAPPAKGARASAPARELPTAEALLAAADEARLAGRAAEGAARLETLLRLHRRDTRAPLAAFTLGRMLLRELGRPRDAAAAFAEARRLAPQGPLAEDALAREVEALVQASDETAAKNRAAEYLRLYPQGRRGTAMQGVLGAR